MKINLDLMKCYIEKSWFDGNSRFNVKEFTKTVAEIKTLLKYTKVSI